jgi:glycosyltransferase involved in cell wall biosynthesis
MSATLSVVVCTHNRCKLLKNCLKGLASQQFEMSSLEVIVVDNASTDATKDVVEVFTRGILPLQYVYEGRRGVSRARATGFRNSTGRYIAYIDDDVQAPPGWCAAICQAFEQNAEAYHGKLAALGGPVEPVFETGRPPWLTADLEQYYARLDLGNALQLFPPGCCPISANTALRREILKDHPWDESLLMCEDVELFNRLTASGFVYLYVPAMRVSHFVPAERCTVEWLLARYHSEGLYQKHVRHGFLPKARLMGRASLELLRFSACLLFGGEQHRLFRRCKLKFQVGILEGLVKVWGVPEDYRERFKPPKSG